METGKELVARIMYIITILLDILSQKKIYYMVALIVFTLVCRDDILTSRLSEFCYF